MAFPIFSPRSRRILLRLLALIVFTFAALMLRRPQTRYAANKIAASLGVAGLPPTYRRFRHLEASLPQHSLELPFPEGKNGRYVKFSNQANYIGWNNCFSDILLNAHLAYVSNRSYVFRDYIWHPSHYPWPRQKWLESNPRNPLTTIISGPIAGGAFEPGDSTPRSISEAWFDVVCPKERRRYINTRDLKPAVANASGLAILQALAEHPPFSSRKLHRSRSCDTRLLSLWESFSASPISRLRGPSTIVHAAVESNARIFVPRGASPGHPPSRDSFKYLLAMHLRRGDYEGHCKWMAYLNTGFYGWNQMKVLPDQFENDPSAADKDAIFLGHCWPDIDGIVAKARQAQMDFPGADRLDTVYISTNEKGGWIDEVRAALGKDGWAVSSTQDLLLDAEQLGVSMAIDMEIASRAAVFIGNGISSFTSNIVYKRLAEGRHPMSIRFW
ncbi:hypothetical protein C8J57DRAFT_1673558 [Mycena rebaudengoi]|nr:hypothetical protein C8J57DRAFT_1673558 [Mycena rebaudengoi]